MSILHFAIYGSILVFIVANLARAIRIARTPIHLRWELYPVPHEKGRAHYGGSRLEEVDWWTHPLKKDHMGELKVMIPEILFLKAVKEHNPKLWLATFNLHFGLYLLITAMVLSMLSGILLLSGIPMGLDGGLIATALHYLIRYLFIIGVLQGFLGALHMMYKRIFDTGLRKYASPSHYFNLFLLGAISLTGILWWIGDSRFVTHVAQLYASIFSGGAFSGPPAIAYWHIGFSLFFLFYLPFTHMTHFFTKYFTYHEVRWEDEPNLPGSKMKKKLQEQLNQKVSWSAPHIKGEGKKTWVDIATSTGEEDK